MPVVRSRSTPLPDFSGVLDDPDEFRTSIEASVAGLVGRAGLTARKTATGSAVLTEALTHFARHGGSELGGFIELLADLPDGVRTIKDAVRLAAGMAEELKAAKINDPVFRRRGRTARPGRSAHAGERQARSRLGDQLHRPLNRQTAPNVRQPATTGPIRLDQAQPGR
jgi:hypothetical protein